MIEYNSGLDEIVVAQSTYKFRDLFEAAQGWGKATRAGDGYRFDCSIRLEKRGAVHDTDCFVEVTGPRFQIERGSELKLGVMLDGVASNGGYLTIPNVDLAYGFGHNSVVNDATHNAGNLYLYNSVVKAPGFWGFFRGPEQRVEIVDCLINGFGRIEGTKSVLRDVIFETAHPRFSVLTPKGVLKEYSGLTLRHSEGAAMYFNPELADDFTVTRSRFENYGFLTYCEPLTHGTKTITFLDCELAGNRLIQFGRNTRFEEAYSFAPRLVSAEGQGYPDTFIKVMDATGEAVFEGLTDSYGGVHTQLTVLSQAEGEDAVKHNPFTVCIFAEDGEPPLEAQLNITEAFDAPLVLLEREVVVVQEVEVPGEGTGTGEGTGGIGTPNDDAYHAIYVCSPSHEQNQHMKQQLVAYLGDTYTECKVYTDIARSAYGRSYSYEQMVLDAMAGKIARLYVWDAPTFGVYRMALAKQMLAQAGVELIEVKERA